MIATSFLVHTCLALPFIPHVNVTLEDGQVITGLRKLGVESFRGIPYAEPPVGDLRFKPSIPFEGEYGDALDFKNTCYQLNPLGIWDIFRKVGAHTEWITSSLMDGLKAGKMSEDCLFLNVYRPPKISVDASYPVLVYFYGGGFQLGTTAMYPGGRFVRDSVKMEQPVIFVSVNYRMGPWGFLGGSAIAEEKSANPGMYDAINALKWVRENIASFGGDPERVTAFGTSSGAQLLGHLALSDTFKKDPLFHALALQSGSLLSSGSASGLSAENQFLVFANASGCPTKAPGAEILACLRDKPAEELYRAQTYNHNINDFYDIATALSVWSPRFDNVLWNESAYDLVSKEGFPDIPLIIGQNEDEGTLVSLMFATQQKNLTDAKLRLAFPYGADNFTEFINMYSDDPEKGAPFRTGNKNQLYPDFKRSSAILTDVFFTIPRRLILENSSSCKTASRFVYWTDAFHGKIPYLGTTHMTDVLWQFYLFRNYASNAFRRYWISFANNHDPNVNTGLVEWPAWDDNEKEMLGIGRRNGSIMVDDYRTVESEYALSHLSIFNTL